jgi:hypothetical protein
LIIHIIWLSAANIKDVELMAGGPGSGLGGLGSGRFHYTEAKDKPNISRPMLKRIAKYFLPYWKLLILLSFLIIITSILGLLPAILIKNIIDIRPGIVCLDR